jgi:5-methylcytosine-specific restriction endonuclease McrA
VARLCRSCAVVTANRSGYCDPHERQQQRQHHNPAYDQPDWRRRQAATLASWRARYGSLCPGWGEPQHYATPDNPLTADHPDPLARGGTHDQTLAVLCRRCNGRKGARRGEPQRA